jgi:hypothetical protein
MFYKFMHVDVSGESRNLERRGRERAMTCMQMPVFSSNQSREDARPSSKNIRSMQGTECDLGSNLLFRITVQCFSSVLYSPPNAFSAIHSNCLSD